MTVTVDVVTEIEDATPADPEANNHAAGTPKGVAVFVGTNNEDTERITGITYGGVAMTKVQYAYNQVAAPSAGNAYLYFLGASVPSGTQSVSIAGLRSTRAAQIVIVSFDAAGDLEVVDSDLVEDAGSTSASVVLSYASRTCMAFGGMVTSEAVVGNSTVLSGMTALHDYDFGARVALASRETTAQASDFTFGWTDSGTNSHALVAMAISEIVLSGDGRQNFIGGMTANLSGGMSS